MLHLLMQFNCAFNSNMSKTDKCFHLVSACIVRIRRLSSSINKKKIGFLSAISPASVLKSIVSEQGCNINPYSDLGGADLIGSDPRAVGLSVRYTAWHQCSASLPHSSFTLGRGSLAQGKHQVLRISIQIKCHLTYTSAVTCSIRNSILPPSSPIKHNNQDIRLFHNH